MADDRLERNDGEKVEPPPELTAGRPREATLLPDESLSITPHLLASVASFFFLGITLPFLADVIFLLFRPEEVVGLRYVPATLVESAVIALAGTAIFFVIGIALLLWQLRRPYASWWPLILAFPVAWALILPEGMTQGGSVRFWITLGTAIAVAFCVHWLALLATCEMLD